MVYSIYQVRVGRIKMMNNKEDNSYPDETKALITGLKEWYFDTHPLSASYASFNYNGLKD